MNKHRSASQREIQHLRALVEQQQHQLTHMQAYQPQHFAEPPSPSLNPDPAYHNAYQLSGAAQQSAMISGCMVRSKTSPRSNQVNAQQRPAPLPTRHSDVVHPSKRPRTVPAASSMAMARSISEGTPFTGSARVPALPRSRNLPTHAAGPSNSMHSRQDSLQGSSNMFDRHQWPGRQDMPSVPEVGLTSGSALIDPEIYLASLPCADDSAASFGTSLTSQPFDENMPFSLQNMSTCGSMTSGPSYTNDTVPMTRENSLFDHQSITGAVDMIQIGSQMSHQSASSYPFTQSSGSGEDFSPLSKKQYLHNDSLNAIGSSMGQPSSNQYAELPSDLNSASMERSISDVSFDSSRSSTIRAKETLREQTARAGKTALAPKPNDDSTDSSPTSKKDGKASIPKAKYVRPRQPRVFCTECTEHPEGFRGDHELRRHRDAKHQSLVRKWMCVDPESRGLPPGVAVVNPLSKCKACKANKKYGAYYNAAAHLRRTHFKEKPSRQKNKRNSTSEDRRGGKGGGDWPSMSELKNWMTEVWVNAHDDACEVDEDLDEDNSHNISASLTDPPFHAVVDFNYPMPTQNPSVMHVLPTGMSKGMVMSTDGFGSSHPGQMHFNYGSNFDGYGAQELMSHGPFGPTAISMVPHSGLNGLAIDDMGFEMVYPQ
ncbi:uncharacterized protein B0I36DRAFT_353989 [Microdochium trichocladiopsis]|uniref:DUF7896 domain-containing protein n=1 Tax=Microdochium trichocladiopsis TaxID=1682393 RepID=A0A9P8XXP9_9PEZI|nr:uncharacterized protein B0I36DRAFT_353989 [Microdochium trichocladiopsis]KAH7021317.1 hypothetical protein B0I36DRAFT_353989 [Microdochium trichocladiopsis]